MQKTSYANSAQCSENRVRLEIASVRVKGTWDGQLFGGQ